MRQAMGLGLVIFDRIDHDSLFSELLEPRSERSLSCNCEHLPPPAPVRGCDCCALFRGAGESATLRYALEEGFCLLAPFEGQHLAGTPILRVPPLCFNKHNDFAPSTHLIRTPVFSLSTREFLHPLWVLESKHGPVCVRVLLVWSCVRAHCSIDCKTTLP